MNFSKLSAYRKRLNGEKLKNPASAAFASEAKVTGEETASSPAAVSIYQAEIIRRHILCDPRLYEGVWTPYRLRHWTKGQVNRMLDRRGSVVMLDDPRIEASTTSVKAV